MHPPIRHRHRHRHRHHSAPTLCHHRPPIPLPFFLFSFLDSGPRIRSREARALCYSTQCSPAVAIHTQTIPLFHLDLSVYFHAPPFLFRVPYVQHRTRSPQQFHAAIPLRGNASEDDGCVPLEGWQMPFPALPSIRERPLALQVLHTTPAPAPAPAPGPGGRHVCEHIRFAPLASSSVVEALQMRESCSYERCREA